jgi:hypothetical protein
MASGGVNRLHLMLFLFCATPQLLQEFDNTDLHDEINQLQYTLEAKRRELEVSLPDSTATGPRRTYGDTVLLCSLLAAKDCAAVPNPLYLIQRRAHGSRCGLSGATGLRVRRWGLSG